MEKTCKIYRHDSYHDGSFSHWHNLQTIVSGGMDKKTPVAVIQDGTTTKQKMITGTVSNIAQKVKRSKIEPPSIIILGKVVSLSKTIGWRKK